MNCSPDSRSIKFSLITRKPTGTGLCRSFSPRYWAPLPFLTALSPDRLWRYDLRLSGIFRRLRMDDQQKRLADCFCAVFPELSVDQVLNASSATVQSWD